MTLDILSPRGRETLVEEERCARVFEAAAPGSRYIKTPKDSPCRVDALIVQADKLVAVVEQKSRFDVDLGAFRGRYRNQWLVTWDKLRVAREYALEYSMPLYGFLWLVRDHALLWQRITDRRGAWQCRYTRATTETRATINGGRVVRPNAFIDMTNATLVYEAPRIVVGDTAQWLAEYEATGRRFWGAAW